MYIQQLFANYIFCLWYYKINQKIYLLKNVLLNKKKITFLPDTIIYNNMQAEP